jgi:glycosyltransferase involved in cell wall biosynthesis
MVKLRIASVSRNLPNPGDVTQGSFIFNRIAAMAADASVQVIQPLPHFPLLRPLPGWAVDRAHVYAGLTIQHAPMFYLPGALKRLDGRWLARAIKPHLCDLQQRGGLDLIDAHFGFPEGVGCIEAGHALGLPVFVTIRGVEAEQLANPVLSRQLVAGLNAAAGCISVSHTLRDLAVRSGIDPERMTVIPNAVDSRTFRPGDRRAARARLAVGDHEALVVSVGNLLAVKRHAALIRAMSELRSRWPNLRLVIVGAASYEPGHPAELHALVQSLDLSDRICFAGKQSAAEVASWLQAADLFALASAREGCCNAVLEALGVGVACVVTNAGDNARFVHDGQNGYIVPTDETHRFGEFLYRALENRNWNSAGISSQLWTQVGDWPGVASRVLEFFGTRLSEWHKR